MSFHREEIYEYLDDSETGEPPDIYAEFMDVILFHPVTDCPPSSEPRVQMKKLGPVGDNPS